MDYLTSTQKANLDADTVQKTGKLKQQSPLFDVQDRHVIVIGGGDTAVDCVGTALRMGAKSVLQFSRRGQAPDKRPKHTPWPCWADTYRVDYAHAEAKALHGRDPREYFVVTKAFLPDSRDPTRVGRVLASSIGPDGLEKDGLIEYPADLVILAMGFTGPDDAIDPSGSLLPRDKNRNYAAPYGDYQMPGGTPWKNLFACGDCRHGASLVVTAIAEGRDCAARVDEYIMGETLLPRSAPLKANPSFYQVPKVASAVSQGFTARRRKGILKVSDAFERGLLVEPPRVEEPEAEIAPLPPLLRHPKRTDVAQAVVEEVPEPPTVVQAPVVPAAPAQVVPVEAPRDPLQGSNMVMWLAVGLSGLCVLNMALTVSLLRATRR